MIIGTVKEIKQGENRVGLAPNGVSDMVKSGHTVLIEAGAGINSRFPDDEYKEAGAKIISSAREVWEKSDMIVKVKEPLPDEFGFLRRGLILFTYLHLAAEERLTRELLAKKVTAVAYETIELDDRTKPLLRPMSEVAGRMAVQVGMHYLEKTNGGFGKLLAGVTGVAPGTVTIIGSGVAGMNAARIAHGVGARTIIIGINDEQLKNAEKLMPGIITMKSTPENISKAVSESDLVVGCVYITGATAPKLVTREMIRSMKPGSVAVDISIDQGGCFETSRKTSHANPVFVDEGVIHYCVPNMPGAVPNTSTIALTNTTLPYILKIANNGEKMLFEDRILSKGINTHDGMLTIKPVADALGLKFTPLKLSSTLPNP